MASVANTLKHYVDQLTIHEPKFICATLVMLLIYVNLPELCCSLKDTVRPNPLVSCKGLQISHIRKCIKYTFHKSICSYLWLNQQISTFNNSFSGSRGPNCQSPRFQFFRGWDLWLTAIAYEYAGDSVGNKFSLTST